MFEQMLRLPNQFRSCNLKFTIPNPKRIQWRIQCNQCESVDLASSLALSEEAVLLGSPSEDVTSVSSSILESSPKKVFMKMWEFYMIMRVGGKEERVS